MANKNQTMMSKNIKNEALIHEWVEYLKKAATKYLLISGLLIICGLWMGFSEFRHWQHVSRVKNQHSFVQGYVLDPGLRGDELFMGIIEISYKINGEIFTIKRSLPQSICENMYKGDRVGIYYDPRNPSDGVLDLECTVKGGIYSIIFYAMLFPLIGIITVAGPLSEYMKARNLFNYGQRQIGIITYSKKPYQRVVYEYDYAGKRYLKAGDMIDRFKKSYVIEKDGAKFVAILVNPQRHSDSIMLPDIQEDDLSGGLAEKIYNAATEPDKVEKFIDKLVSPIYQAKHKYAAINPQNFTRLDLRFYDSVKQELKLQGFQHIKDEKDITISKLISVFCDNTFTRIMLNADGIIYASIFHYKPRLVSRFLRMRSGKIVAFSTEFANGHHLVTSNTLNLLVHNYPPEIHIEPLSADIPVAVLLQRHRERLEEYLRKNPSVKPLVFRSIEDIHQSDDRFRRLSEKMRLRPHSNRRLYL